VVSITARIDAVTRIPEEYRHPVVPAPKSVKIELTGRCNLRCRYCALPSRESQPTCDMDLALFQRITREMRDAGVQEIGLFYLGESFMAPRLLVDALRHLKRELAMPYVFLTSNGTMASKDVVTELMENGLDSLKWSVNAADEEQYEEITGASRRMFCRAIQNIRDAWFAREAGGYKTGLYASSILYDDEQRDRMRSLLRRHVLSFVDEHYWLPLYSRMSGGKFGSKPTAGNQGRLEALVPALPCWAVLTEAHVRVDGHLSACCFGADDRYDIGSLNEASFMGLWNGGPMVELRKAHLKGDVTGTMCEACPAYA